MNIITYNKLKNIILNYYRKARVQIELKGSIDTRFFIENTRIMINKNKLIISNNDTDLTIDFMWLKKIKFIGEEHIELIFREFKVFLEV